MSITLITPTGGRPEAFSLLERFISKQTYQGDIQWIVSDDCDPPTPCTMGQTIVRPTPLWQSGQNTQCRNLLSLIPLVLHDKILICEDDDAYSPYYLETMSNRLDISPIVGETNAHYYNVSTRSYRVLSNVHHASLCQTGIRAEVLPSLSTVCQHNKPWVDMELWRTWRRSSQLFRPDPVTGPLCVGIKGMPGRIGIGSGHRVKFGGAPDPNGTVLRDWVGEDAEVYMGYYRNGNGNGNGNLRLGAKAIS